MCSIGTPKMGLWNGADKLYFGISSITQFGDAAILWFRFIRAGCWSAAVSRMPDGRRAQHAEPARRMLACSRTCQQPLSPYAYPALFPSAAFAVSMAGMVSSEINAIVVMNFFMTHLLSELSV